MKRVVFELRLGEAVVDEEIEFGDDAGTIEIAAKFEEWQSRLINYRWYRAEDNKSAKQNLRYRHFCPLECRGGE